MLSSKRIQGTISGLAAATIWGAMYVVSKVVLESVPPFVLVSSRLVIGGTVLAVAGLLTRTRRIAPADFLRVFTVGLIGYGISLGLQFIGTKLSSAANGALVTSATPAFILLFAAIILGERLTSNHFLALVISTAGVLVVIRPSATIATSGLLLGNLALVGAALTWALYSVLIRAVSRQVDVLTVSLIALIGGLPITLPASVYEVSTTGIGAVSSTTIYGVLFLGVIATAVAMFLWNNAFALLEARQASLTFFAQPVSGALLGWYFLHEQISPAFLLGGALISTGIFLSSRE